MTGKGMIKSSKTTEFKELQTILIALARPAFLPLERIDDAHCARGLDLGSRLERQTSSQLGKIVFIIFQKASCGSAARFDRRRRPEGSGRDGSLTEAL